MIGLICNVFTFAIGMVKLGLGLIWGVLQFLLGLLGGIFSIILTLGGLVLAGALVFLAVTRRSEYKQHQQSKAESSQRVYDVDNEEFTSFYDQFRTEQKTE